MYQEVYIANRHEDDIWGDQGKPFGDIAPVTEKSNVAKKAVHFGTADHTTELSDKTVDSLSGYLDNLSGAVTIEAPPSINTGKISRSCPTASSH